MDTTIREKIIQEFLTRAALIRVSSPQVYATDIGGKVLRARPKVDPGELPCVVLWPQVEDAESKYGRQLCKMTLKIEGVVEYGAADPSETAEKILGDLIYCFVSPSWDRRRLIVGASPVAYANPYAESVVYTGGGTNDYPEGAEIAIGVHINLIVSYYTQIGNPYAQ